MKLSTVVMGVGVGAFALVGCGGSSGPGEVPLKDPTAKIEKSQVPEVLDRLTYASNFFGILGGISSGEGKLAKKSDDASEEEEYANLPASGTFDCSSYVPEKDAEIKGGTYTIKYTTGSPDDKYKKSGNVAYTEDRKKCIDHKGFLRTEKRNTTQTWEVNEKQGKWSGTTELASEKSERVKDEKNKYTLSTFYYEWNYEKSDKGNKYFEKDSYSAKGLHEGHPFEKYGIVTTTKHSAEYEKNNETVSGTLRGSFNYEKYQGWFTVVTDKEFVIEHPYDESAACTQGKVTIKGGDNTTIVVECKDKEVKVTYNGEEVEL